MPLEVEMFRPSIERQIAKDNQAQILIILSQVEKDKAALVSEVKPKLKIVNDEIIAIDKLISENNIEFNKETEARGASRIKGEGKSSKTYENKINNNQKDKERFIAEREALKNSMAYKQRIIDENAINEMRYYGFEGESVFEKTTKKDRNGNKNFQDSKTKNKKHNKSAIDENSNNNANILEKLLLKKDNKIKIDTRNGLEREIEALEEISKRPQYFSVKL